MPLLGNCLPYKASTQFLIDMFTSAVEVGIHRHGNRIFYILVESLKAC